MVQFWGRSKFSKVSCHSIWTVKWFQSHHGEIPLIPHRSCLKMKGMKISKQLQRGHLSWDSSGHSCTGWRMVLDGLEDLLHLLTFSNSFILNKCIFRTSVALYCQKIRVDFTEIRDKWMFFYAVVCAVLHAGRHLKDAPDTVLLFLYGLILNSVGSQVRMSLPCPTLVICRQA